jgi:hypothetical protein
MAAPRSTPVLEEVKHQLVVERQLRGAAEQAARDLRRDNARLMALTQKRTHYVLLIPKPKWPVWRDKLEYLATATYAWVVATYKAGREAVWPTD